MNKILPLKIPYPYRSMLAICSDLDETVSADVYFSTSAYLNSRKITPFGRGLGLEVGNTLYFYMDPGALSYWNASGREQARFRELIQSGHIDCIHSYGDTATSRSQVSKTLDHLSGHDCHLKVWIDHAIAPSNFGRDIMQGYGDVSGSDVYHADLTLSYGVKFVWMGRVTSMHGQDAPLSLLGIWSADQSSASGTTLCKEAVKVTAGLLGNRKYSFHRANRLLRDTSLRDSAPVVEFMRTNPHPCGVSFGDNAEGLGDALNDRFLDNIVRRNAKAVVYTHMGKKIDPVTGFSARTRDALEKLAGRFRRQQILVTTTERLLAFAQMTQNIRIKSRETESVTVVDLSCSGNVDNFDGLSFEVPSDRQYVVESDGRSVSVDRLTTGNDRIDVLMVPWKIRDYD